MRLSRCCVIANDVCFIKALREIQILLRSLGQNSVWLYIICEVKAKKVTAYQSFHCGVVNAKGVRLV